MMRLARVSSLLATIAVCTEAMSPTALSEHIADYPCNETVLNVWPFIGPDSTNCSVNPWYCARTGLAYDAQASGLISAQNNVLDCSGLCLAEPTCTAALLDVSGMTCYLHSDLSMWTLEYNLYNGWQRYSVERVCRPTSAPDTSAPPTPAPTALSEHIADYPCNETALNVWPFIVPHSTNCSVNPWYCARTGLAYDAGASGLISAQNNVLDCSGLCLAEPTCTAALLDVSGMTCYLHSDLSMWTLEYNLYNGWQRYSVERVCRPTSAPATSAPPTPAPTALSEHIADYPCNETALNVWPFIVPHSTNCSVNPWYCARTGLAYDAGASGLISAQNNVLDCSGLCLAEPTCTAALLDVSGMTCYLHSDLSMWTLQYNMYNGWQRYSVERVCRPTSAPDTSAPPTPAPIALSEHIADYPCNETALNVWPFIVPHSTNCSVNPWYCARTGLAYDAQASGLISAQNNVLDCSGLCLAEPTCTAALLDVSGMTCYLHSDLSMWTLEYNMYNGWQRYSVERVCRPTSAPATFAPPTPAPTALSEHIADYPCNETALNVWPFIVPHSTNCSVNPWYCARTGLAYDADESGLISAQNNVLDCSGLCLAEPTCTAALLDVSGMTCYLHSDLSMWTLEYNLYNGWQRYSVERVCRPGVGVVTPTLLAVNADHSSGPGANVIDGSVTNFWNAGHVSGWNVPNWASFDFGAPRVVTSFSFYSFGDVIHDVKDWELQMSETGMDGWTTVVSGVGVSGSDDEQTTTFDGVVSRYWRFYIPTRHTGFQAYVKEVVFYSNVVTQAPTAAPATPAPATLAPATGVPAAPGVVTPTLLAVNAEHSSGPAVNAIDGSVTNFWNAGHVSGWNVPNWASFDFGAPRVVTSFSFYSFGDVTHDVKDWELQMSETGTDGWTSVVSGVGVSGSDDEQTTTFDGVVSRYWRFYIPTRHTGFQAYVKEVVFYSNVANP